MSGTNDFWSRRRAGVQAEAQAEQNLAEAQTLAEQQTVLADKSDAEVLEEFGLPDPSTMKMGDDFSGFMAKAVPDHLRRQALRTLWRSNPVLANVDMLVDYGEDFTDSAMVMENMQTAYQVGKGMLKHVEEMARQAEERENPPDPLPEEQIEDAEVLVASTDIQAAPLPEPMELDDDDEEAEMPMAPRRMKFRPVEASA